MQKNILSNTKSFASIFTCQFSKIQIFYSKPLPKPKKLQINVFKGILLLQKLYALFHIDRFPRTNNPSNYKPVRSRVEWNSRKTSWPTVFPRIAVVGGDSASLTTAHVASVEVGQGKRRRKTES